MRRSKHNHHRNIRQHRAFPCVELGLTSEFTTSGNLHEPALCHRKTLLSKSLERTELPMARLGKTGSDPKALNTVVHVCEHNYLLQRWPRHCLSRVRLEKIMYELHPAQRPLLQHASSYRYEFCRFRPQM